MSTNEAQSEVTQTGGAYIMKYSVGTPPFEILGIADTGSDLIWSQCKPCKECYDQDAPLFDPSKSRTYRKLPCSSTQCVSNPNMFSCSSDGASCSYHTQYGDQSYSFGDLAYDTVSLESDTGRPVSFRNIAIGCGNDNAGTFQMQDSGIVGLGGGPLSLVSQLGSSIDGKFSYCLVPGSLAGETVYNASSKLNFGTNAVISGRGTLSTPIVSKDPNTFYFLTLEALSVGSKRISVGGSSFDEAEEGNIIIDSGTTLTILPEEAYLELRSAVSDRITAPVVQDQTLLCYRSTSTSDTFDDIDPPVITAHFKGADVKLGAINTFVRASDDTVCLAFTSSEQISVSIYGNVAQRNFLVGYDIERKRVSFKPTDCTQH